MTFVERNDSVREYFEIQKRLDELAARQEEIKDALKEDMVMMGVEELEGIGWRATWHNTVTSRFDSAAFKKDNGDLYKAYQKPVNGTRFTLNEVKVAA